MKAEIVRRLVNHNNERFQEIEQEKADLTQQQEELKQATQKLQQVCPHENVEERLEQDVAESKLYRYCKDCGARC